MFWTNRANVLLRLSIQNKVILPLSTNYPSWIFAIDFYYHGWAWVQKLILLAIRHVFLILWLPQTRVFKTAFNSARLSSISCCTCWVVQCSSTMTLMLTLLCSIEQLWWLIKEKIGAIRLTKQKLFVNASLWLKLNVGDRRTPNILYVKTVISMLLLTCHRPFQLVLHVLAQQRMTTLHKLSSCLAFVQDKLLATSYMLAAKYSFDLSSELVNLFLSHFILH